QFIDKETLLKVLFHQVEQVSQRLCVDGLPLPPKDQCRLGSVSADQASVMLPLRCRAHPSVIRLRQAL
ncbi:MAG TPA: hypothetical protein VIJ25_21205, partial [Methylococcales bacterium]